jgi:two-component system CheB/CheR fusion protein
VTRPPARSAKPSFPIVGVGASAGGLEAFSQFLAPMPAQTGMAFVYVQHLDPNNPSVLAELLARATRLPVTEARNGLAVEPDHVYVITPNTEIAMAEGAIRLLPRSEGGHHLPIDTLFRSLAESQKNKAIGVILSGTASDGVLGLKAIKAEGGLTFAQDPATAKHDGMPRSAIAAGVVDFILPPAKIAEELLRVRRHPFLNHAKAAAALPAGSEGALQQILALLRSATGVDFTDYKPGTINRRIQRRMVLQRMESLDEYVQLLRERRDEVQALHDDLLIHVTGFFRNPARCAVLAKRVFPALVKGRPTDSPLRVWVPGCSTGEEAYSLAICLLEFLGERKNAPSIRVFASDIGAAALDKARAGIYPESIAKDVSPDRLRRFFTRTDGGYRIDKSVRELCVFARQDLTKDPPFSHVDLVSCCNVLIYLAPPLQKRALSVFHYALRPGGFLVLGNAETALAATTMFAPVDGKQRIYVRKEAGTPPHFGFAVAAKPDEPGPRPREEPGTALDVQKQADRIILEEFAPAAVVVNDDLEILQFRGQTSPYLEPAPGRASLNLLRMARGGLGLELRSAIQKARKTESVVRKDGLRLDADGRSRHFSLAVVPIRGLAAEERAFLVLFKDTAPPARPQPERVKGRPGTKSGDGEVARLRRELAATSEYLQTVIEEQEAANEELRSTSEEALSANEELQSTNEELETAKEELEALNEELNTVNDELRHRNAELTEARAYAEAIVATVREPLIVLDRDLRVKTASQSFYRTFQTTPERTEGRRLAELGEGEWNIPEVQRRLDEILHERTSFQDFDIEHEFRALGRRTMRLNAREIVQEASRERLILLAIEDVTHIADERGALLQREKAAREAAEAANHAKDDFLAMVSHELRTPLNSLVSWTHLLATGQLDPATEVRGRAAIRRAVQSQVKLIDDLLDVSRITSGKLRLQVEPLHLAPVIEAALETIRPAAEAKQIRLRTELNASAGALLGDADRLQQVVWNLLANAVKFTPKGGEVVVRLERVGTSLRIQVADTGPGIPPASLPHLFERFWQEDTSASRPHGGLGLGLAIARHLVELHGGTIAAANSEGGGAVLTVELPIPALVPQARPSAAVAGQPAAEGGPAQPSLDGLRVLVVDNDADARDVLSTVLAQRGAEVLTAASAAEALGVLERDRLDVLVSDIGMPDEDGYALIAKVRALPPERGGQIPAAALTAYAGAEDRDHVLAAGFQRHVPKPADPVALVQVVAELASGDRSKR